MADRSIDGRWIAFELADRAAHLGDNAIPAPELMSVPAQISEERGIKRAVSATRADRLDLAQDHRAEEGNLAAGADEEDHLSGAEAGYGKDGRRYWTVVELVEIHERRHQITATFTVKNRRYSLFNKMSTDFDFY